MKKNKKWLCGLLMVATAGITGCDDNFNSITLDKECIGSEKPDTDSCTCIDNTWKCDENSGNVCDEDECNGECIDGKCIAKPNCDKCMFSCDETGKCLCDLSCEDNCRTDGSCSEIECPTQCPGNCDDNGICIESVTCPVECPDDCSEEGLCYEVDEPVCPVECPFDCDEQGHCPDIICPVICETECGADAKCICPLSCQNGCNENGTCVCPSTCKAACNEDGTCACPKSCATSCDATGLCKCPEKCSENCNEDGECQAKCADLDVEKFYFGQAEVDLLINSKITLRESASSTLYMKTVGSQTKIDLSQIPCADKIKITVSDNTVIKAAKSGTGVKFTAINPGTATVTASVDGTEFKATIKVHVLNFKKLNDPLENHIYRRTKDDSTSARFSLYKRDRIAQSFDLVDNNFYFTQAGKVKDAELSDGGIYVFKYNSKSYMFLAKSGHGQNLSFENNDDGKLYVWMGNYGAINKDNSDDVKNGTYKFAQTLGRVEFKTMQYYPGDIKEHYYISDKDSYYYGMDAGLDVKNNRLLVRAAYKNKNGGRDQARMKIYKYKDLDKAKTKSIKLESINITSASNKGTYTPDENGFIKVKDLSTLSPYKEINFSTVSDDYLHSDDKTLYYNFPQQGFAIENGIIYGIAGMPEKIAPYKSKILLYLFTLDGKYLGSHYFSTKSGLDSNKRFIPKEFDDLLNFTQDGKKYKSLQRFEPEGIRVKDGMVYLNIAARLDMGGSVASRQLIFVYDLTKK